MLVTGASGFVGRHTIDPLLHRGFEVHAVAARAAPTHAGAVWHRADLLDVQAAAALLDVVRPAALLHFAWYTVPGAYWSSPENERWLEASVSLIAEFARRGGRRVVVAGTCAEYDWTLEGRCHEGHSPLRPATRYGQAKLRLLQALERIDLDFAWGRIFQPFGPHERPERLVPSVIRALLRREPARCTHGRQLRDFIYVADLGDAFAALVDSSVQGAINLGSGEITSIRELVGRIGARLGADQLIEFGALPAPEEPLLLVPVLERQANELGWRPSTPLDVALARTVSFFQEVELAR